MRVYVALIIHELDSVDVNVKALESLAEKYSATMFGLFSEHKNQYIAYFDNPESPFLFKEEANLFMPKVTVDLFSFLET